MEIGAACSALWQFIWIRPYRSDGGWPLQQQLASKETSAADSLWNQTLVKMAENVNMY